MLTITNNCISKYRIEKGLTQWQLADLCGLSRNALNFIELGRYTPRLTTAVTIAYYLGVDVYDLFYFGDENDCF